MDHVETDVAVIGSGVIGLAIARELAHRGREVVIFEAEQYPSFVTSSRNSGVIHAGHLNRPGSLKALFCVAGSRMLYRYAQERKIEYKQCEKLVVVTDPLRIRDLVPLKNNAEANGIHGTKLLTPFEAKRLEPEVSCYAALHVPQSGLINIEEFTKTLGTDAHNAGVITMLKSPIIRGDVRGEKLLIQTSGAQEVQVSCTTLINAAGLGAQNVARNMRGLNPKTIPGQKLGKGNYFKLDSKIKPPFQRLIYPLPVPGSSGLHVRLDFDGKTTIFGPDLEFVDRIDYRPNEERKSHFERAIIQYWPNLPKDALYPDYAGIRPKIVLADNDPFKDDFLVQGPKQHGVPGLFNFYGIESPGLTASLALAEAVAEQITPLGFRKHVRSHAVDFPYALN